MKQTARQKNFLDIERLVYHKYRTEPFPELRDYLDQDFKEKCIKSGLTEEQMEDLKQYAIKTWNKYNPKERVEL